MSSGDGTDSLFQNPLARALLMQGLGIDIFSDEFQASVRRSEEIAAARRAEERAHAKARRQSGMHLPPMKPNTRRPKTWVDRAPCQGPLPRDTLDPIEFVKFDLALSLWLKFHPKWVSDHARPAAASGSSSSASSSSSSSAASGGRRAGSYYADAALPHVFSPPIQPGERFQCPETGADFRIPASHEHGLAGSLGRGTTEQLVAETKGYSLLLAERQGLFGDAWEYGDMLHLFSRPDVEAMQRQKEAKEAMETRKIQEELAGQRKAKVRNEQKVAELVQYLADRGVVDKGEGGEGKEGGGEGKGKKSKGKGKAAASGAGSGAAAAMRDSDSDDDDSDDDSDDEAKKRMRASMEPFLERMMRDMKERAEQQAQEKDDKSPLPLINVFVPVDGLRAVSPLVMEGWQEVTDAVNGRFAEMSKYRHPVRGDHHKAYIICEAMGKVANRSSFKAPMLPPKEQPMHARRRCAAMASAALQRTIGVLRAMDSMDSHGDNWAFTDDGGAEPRAILEAVASHMTCSLGVLNVLADAGDGLGKRGGGKGGFGLGLEAYRPLLEDLGTLRPLLEALDDLQEAGSMAGDFEGLEDLRAVLGGTVQRVYGVGSIDGLGGGVTSDTLEKWVPVLLGDLARSPGALEEAVGLGPHLGPAPREALLAAQEENEVLKREGGVSGYSGLVNDLGEDVAAGGGEQEDEDDEDENEDEEEED